MSIPDRSEIASNASRGQHDGGPLGYLRAIALIAVMAGAVGSLGLMFRAGQNTPRFLLVLFIFWILAPFAALAWLNMVSMRWSVLTRATLYCVTVVITLGSLAYYGRLIPPPERSAHAFVFVAVPPVSCLLIAIVVPLAALISRRLSQRGTGA